MNNPNARPREQAGPGGDAVDTSTNSVTETRDNGNNIIGYGCPLYRRARDLSIAGAMLVLHNPTPRELKIIVDGWRSPRIHDLDAKLFELLIERTAPSRECADPTWWRALTDEDDCTRIVAARMHGWMPPELIEDAAAAFAAVVFGRLRVKGDHHAA